MVRPYYSGGIQTDHSLSISMLVLNKEATKMKTLYCADYHQLHFDFQGGAWYKPRRFVNDYG